MTIKSGEPQLTMSAICSLEDLAPFFAALCDGVTRQQTRCKPKKISHSKSSGMSHTEKMQCAKNKEMSSSSDLINGILERDFLESVTKQ